MLKVVNMRWLNGQGQTIKEVKVKVKMGKIGWSKPRSNSQGQMVKMVKSVKLVRWSGG